MSRRIVVPGTPAGLRAVRRDPLVVRADATRDGLGLSFGTVPDEGPGVEALTTGRILERIGIAIVSGHGISFVRVGLSSPRAGLGSGTTGVPACCICVAMAVRIELSRACHEDRQVRARMCAARTAAMTQPHRGSEIDSGGSDMPNQQ